MAEVQCHRADLDTEFPQPLELDLARYRLARRNVIDLCLGRLGPVGSLTEESYAGSEQRSGAQQIDSQLANSSLPWPECVQRAACPRASYWSE